MGTQLAREYDEGFDKEALLEEEKTIERIKEQSILEYEAMKPNNKLNFKTALIIAGTMILIALIARTMYNTSNTTNTRDNSNKIITDKINIELNGE